MTGSKMTQLFSQILNSLEMKTKDMVIHTSTLKEIVGVLRGVVLKFEQHEYNICYGTRATSRQKGK